MTTRSMKGLDPLRRDGSPSLHGSRLAAGIQYESPESLEKRLLEFRAMLRLEPTMRIPI
jgi:hypothetical protein